MQVSVILSNNVIKKNTIKIFEVHCTTIIIAPFPQKFYECIVIAVKRNSPVLRRGMLKICN